MTTNDLYRLLADRQPDVDTVRSSDFSLTLLMLAIVVPLLVFLSMRFFHRSWYTLHPRWLGYFMAASFSGGQMMMIPWSALVFVPMWAGAIWLALGRTPLWLRRLSAWSCDDVYKEQILQGPSFYPRWWDPNDPRRLVKH